MKSNFHGLEIVIEGRLTSSEATGGGSVALGEAAMRLNQNSHQKIKSPEGMLNEFVSASSSL